MTELQCPKCRVWVGADKLDAPNRCPDGRCPLNQPDRLIDPAVRSTRENLNVTVQDR